MFIDTYRFERDFFYDANMHGVDWDAMRDHYGTLLDDAVTRWDVNFVLGEFIGELNASHTYRSGGDAGRSRERGVGMLGVDWELANGAYRIKPIVRGGPWDIDARSPLDEPGVDVQRGRLRAGRERRPARPGRRSLGGVRGPRRQDRGRSRSTAPPSTRARARCWSRRPVSRARRSCASAPGSRSAGKAVDEATGGRVGYIYVQSTGVDAQNELVRQFMAQWTQGRADHRRALQQRRADSRPVHRAAQPSDAGVLGRARWRAPGSGRPWRTADRRSC